MELKKFILENDVEFSKNLIDGATLKNFKEELGVRIGDQLSEYLLSYGYLAYDCVELYGINSLQKMDSDMIKQTKYLHEYYPCTTPFVALENRGEGDYILIDSNDTIYEFEPSLDNNLQALNLKLFDYIISRFQNC